MPNYEIVVMRDQRQEATLEVVADDPEAAFHMVEVILQRGPAPKWMDDFHDDQVLVYDASNSSQGILYSDWAKDADVLREPSQQN